jgi:hypothetical protein
VEPRARRFAIREYLGTARAALDRGDRAAALAALNSALELDPEYLAAQALKDRIEHATDFNREFPRTGSLEPPAAAAPPRAANPQPAFSAEGWARFESRARARRAEKRAAAARALIARRRFQEARATIEEIREIDAGHPELVSLSIELDAAEHLRPRGSRHLGPAVAAVTVFAALLFGARYVALPGSQATPPAVVARAEPAASPVVAGSTQPAAAQSEPASQAEPPSAPSPAVVDGEVAPEPAAVPQQRPVARPPAEDADLRPPAASPRAALPPTRVDPPPARPIQSPPADRIDDTPAVATAGAAPAPPPAAQPAIRMPSVTPAVTPAVTGASLEQPLPVAPQPDTSLAARVGSGEAAAAAFGTGGAAAAVVPVVPDEEQVRRTLQMYQSAYESLDAQSAGAVWPRVDRAALQRAFDGLESQRLTFNNCQVEVRGSLGSAVCRGTTRYVPKVGSHEPRIEPRTWTFALRKTGDEWQIDSARAER